MGLFIRKPLADLISEANESGNKTLKRTLGPLSLIALGVGVIIGAGLFSITGTVASGYTGPAITLSFAIAALGCCFAGLCYAEFASMIPVAGSAYTYSYATMGELVAWIIGWDLVLEYCVAATTVSISWSRYLVVFLEGFGIHLPHALTACPWDGGIVNIPALIIVVLMSLLLIRGTEGSSIFNGIIVFLKVSVVLVFVFLGWKYIRMENYTPYIPANTGTLGEFGFSGILRGAAIVFFAFLGFDAVSTAAQETKHPKRDMPIGILMSLAVCTIRLGAGKCAMSFGKAFGLGILCNLLVCLGVMAANSAKDTAGRLLGAYLPVCFFVLCGFEHCIANLYYIGAALMAAAVPQYAALAAEAGVDLAPLTLAGAAANLIPVTLGNIVGGLGLGLLLWYCHTQAEKKEAVR